MRDNDILLEFLGFELIMDDPIDSPEGYYHNGEFPLHADELDFENNWNHLMFLIDQIETLETEFDGRFGVYISSNSCTIQSTKLRLIHPTHYSYFSNCTYNTKIESTYHCVVQFIKWYNENHKK